MNLKYSHDLENENKIKDIVEKLGLNYINSDFIKCVSSKKSSSKRIIARLHPSLKICSFAFNLNPMYIIELVSENFNKLNEEDKIKVFIHELLHIPKTFSGAARNHEQLDKKLSNGKMSKYLNSECKTINYLYNEYCKRK